MFCCVQDVRLNNVLNILCPCSFDKFDEHQYMNKNGGLTCNGRHRILWSLLLVDCVSWAQEQCCQDPSSQSPHSVPPEWAKQQVVNNNSKSFIFQNVPWCHLYQNLFKKDHIDSLIRDRCSYLQSGEDSRPKVSEAILVVFFQRLCWGFSVNLLFYLPIKLLLFFFLLTSSTTGLCENANRGRSVNTEWVELEIKEELAGRWSAFHTKGRTQPYLCPPPVVWLTLIP